MKADRPWRGLGYGWRRAVPVRTYFRICPRPQHLFGPRACRYAGFGQKRPSPSEDRSACWSIPPIGKIYPFLSIKIKYSNHTIFSKQKFFEHSTDPRVLWRDIICIKQIKGECSEPRSHSCSSFWFQRGGQINKGDSTSNGVRTIFVHRLGEGRATINQGFESSDQMGLGCLWQETERNGP